MVYIDWQLGLIANFFMLFTILQLHHYFLKSFNIKYLLSDIAISLVFGYIGLFVDDVLILIFVCSILIFDWLFNVPHELDMQKSISLIMAANVEVVLFSLGTYTSRIIFFISNGEWKLRVLEIFQQNFIMLSIIINIILLATFLLIIRRFRPNIVKLWIQIKQYNLGKRVFIMSFSVFVSFMIILIISDLQSVTATIQASTILIFTVVLIVTYRQMIFFIHTIALKNEAQEKSVYNKQLNEYLTSVQQQYTELRKFKHDFQNIMLSLKSLVDNSNSDELKSYYQDIVKERTEITNVNGGNISQVSTIDNGPIRGLIIQKFFSAKSENIKFNLELTKDHYHFNNDTLIIVRILGILLDNALEYVQTTTTKEVTCAITQSDNITEITVDNPINDKLNFKDIFQSGYSTKDSHSGFGLSNARKLISESNNLYLETKVIHSHLMMTLIIVGGD